MIREATPADASAIHALKRAAFDPYRTRYTAGCFDATVLDAERIRSRMAQGPVWVWDDGQIRGTVAAKLDGHGLYVRGMAVHPEAQRMGVGRALLDACAAYARSEGLHRMWLSTTRFLEASAALYEAYGFEPTEGPADLEGTPLRSYALSL